MKENTRLNVLKELKLPKPPEPVQESLMPESRFLSDLNSVMRTQTIIKYKSRVLKELRLIDSQLLNETIEGIKNSLPPVQGRPMRLYDDMDSAKRGAFIYVKNFRIVKELLENKRVLKDEVCERAVNWIKQHPQYLRLFGESLLRIDKSKVLSYLVENKKSVLDVEDFFEYKTNEGWVKAREVYNIWFSSKAKIIQRAFRTNILNKKSEMRHKAALAITRFIRKAAIKSKTIKLKKKIVTNTKTLFERLQQTKREIGNDSAIKICIGGAYKQQNEACEIIGMYRIFELINPKTTVVFVATQIIPKSLREYYKTLVSVLKVKDLEKRLIILSLNNNLKALSPTIDPSLKILCCSRTLGFLKALSGKNQRVEIMCPSAVTIYGMQLAVRLNIAFDPNALMIPSITKRIDKSFEIKPLVLGTLRKEVQAHRKLKNGGSLQLEEHVARQMVKRSDTVLNINARNPMFRSVEDKSRINKVELMLPALTNGLVTAIGKVNNSKLKKEWSQNVFKARGKLLQGNLEKPKNGMVQTPNLGAVFKTEILSWNGQPAHPNDFSIDLGAFLAKKLKSCAEIRSHLARFMTVSTFDEVNEFQVVFIGTVFTITTRIVLKNNQPQNSSEIIFTGLNEFFLCFEASEHLKSVEDLTRLLKTYQACLVLKKYGQLRFEELGFVVSADLNIDISDPLIIKRAGILVSTSSVEGLTAEQQKIKWILHRAVQLSTFYKQIAQRTHIIVQFTEITKNGETIDILPTKSPAPTDCFDLLKTSSFTDLFLKNGKFVYISKLPLHFFKRSKFEELFGFLKLEGFTYNFNTGEGLLALPYLFPNKKHVFDLIIVYKDAKRPFETLDKFISYVKVQKSQPDRDNLAALARMFKTNRK